MLRSIILTLSMVPLLSGCTADRDEHHGLHGGIEPFLVERIVADPDAAAEDLIQQGGQSAPLRFVETEDRIPNAVRFAGTTYLFAEADSWLAATRMRFEVGDVIYHFILESRQDLEAFIENRGLRDEVRLPETDGPVQSFYRGSDREFFLLAINEQPNQTRDATE